MKKISVSIISVLMICFINIIHAQVSITIYDNEHIRECESIPYPSITPSVFNPIKLQNLVEYNDQFELIFEDDFSGNELDINKWVVVKPTDLKPHGKLLDYDTTIIGTPFNQRYKILGINNPFPENTELSNGLLKLRATHLGPNNGIWHNLVDGEYWILEYAFRRDMLDPGPNGSYLTNGIYDPVKSQNIVLKDGIPNHRYFPFSSNEINTKQLFSKVKIEARIKIPSIDGPWPAFWLYGGDVENDNPITSKFRQEIDVFEFVVDGYFDHPLSAGNAWRQSFHHWGLQNSCTAGAKDDRIKNFTAVASNSDFFVNQWHTYGIVWDDFKLVWTLDGLEIPFSTIARYYYYPYGHVGEKGYQVPISNKNMLLTLLASGHTIYEFADFPNSPMNIVLGFNIKSAEGENPIPYPGYYMYNSWPVGQERIMEVDWIRVYAPKSCNSDVNLQCGLPNFIQQQIVTVPSAVFADNISIGGNNCGITINNFNIWETDKQENVKLIATNQIRLKSGFKVEGGAKLHARIENCNTANYRLSNPETPPNLNIVLANESETSPITNNQPPVSITEYHKYLPTDFNYQNSNANTLQSNYFNITPNPFTNKIQINNLSEAVRIKIYNTLGAEVLDEFISPEDNIVNTSSLIRGYYLVEVYNTNNDLLKKIKLIKTQ